MSNVESAKRAIGACSAHKCPLPIRMPLRENEDVKRVAMTVLFVSGYTIHTIS
jgi:hypothetical protein